jgi:hypothetical protein
MLFNSTQYIKIKLKVKSINKKIKYNKSNFGWTCKIHDLGYKIGIVS